MLYTQTNAANAIMRFSVEGLGSGANQLPAAPAKPPSENRAMT